MGAEKVDRWNKPPFRVGDTLRIPCIVSDLSGYVNFRLYPGAEMRILHREDAGGGKAAHAMGTQFGSHGRSHSQEGKDTAEISTSTRTGRREAGSIEGLSGPFQADGVAAQ